MLAGCGAGQDAQTALTAPSIAGVSADVGDIAVRNAVVLFASAGYPAGGEAPVQFAVANNGREPVRLVRFESEGAASATLQSVELVGGTGQASASPSESPSATPSESPSATPSESPSAAPSESPSAPPDGGTAEVSLAPGQLAIVTLQLTGLTEELNGTSSVPLTLTFDNGATLPLVVPMAPPEQPLPREAPAVEEPEH